MAGAPNYGSWHTSATPEDDVRTIFVTGFPIDTKERELQNLLRWWPGYEACQLTVKGDTPIGFALFNSPAAAVAARDALQGLVFDLETSSTLRAEMAKKNLFMKKGVLPPRQPWEPQVTTSPSPSPYDSNKRMRGAEMPGPPYVQPVSYLSPSMEPAPGTMYQTYSVPSYSMPTSPAPMVSPGGYSASPHVAAHHHMASPGGYSTPQRPFRGGGGGGGDRGDNPPCNTLFVGNLGDGISEQELNGLFGAMAGYRQMKVLRQANGMVCFVEFADVETATAAHASAQGRVLVSNDRGGLRVQFSRNPFGRKRDGSFHPGSAAAAAASGGAVAAEAPLVSEHPPGAGAGEPETNGAAIPVGGIA